LTTFDDKRLHFGFSLGVNTVDFNIAHYNVIGDNPKFDPLNIEVVDGKKYCKQLENQGRYHKYDSRLYLGIVTNLRLSDSFDLRFLPGMSFGERKLTYNIRLMISTTPGIRNHSIKSTFLDFPLLVKYKSRR